MQKMLKAWGDAKKCFHLLAKIQLLTTPQILYNVLPVRRCLWVGRETFAAILRHFIIARLDEPGIILHANPDFNTGIFTSYLVYTLQVSDGRFRDYRQEMCWGQTLQENPNYSKECHGRGLHYQEIRVLEQGGRQVESFRTHISNVKLIILSDQSVWKLNLHKWARGLFTQVLKGLEWWFTTCPTILSPNMEFSYLAGAK